jgi:hypothetical protein
MKRSQIIKTLEQFRKITPNEAYSRHSLNVILSTLPKQKIEKPYQTKIQTTSFVSLIKNSWRIAVLSGAMIALITAIYFATSELSPLFLPSLNQNKVVAEAQMIKATIDIQLSHIQKFEESAQQSTIALKKVASNNPTHLNESVIKNEEKEIDLSQILNQSPTTTQSINSILNELTK